MFRGISPDNENCWHTKRNNNNFFVCFQWKRNSQPKNLCVRAFFLSSLSPNPRLHSQSTLQFSAKPSHSLPDSLVALPLLSDGISLTKPKVKYNNKPYFLIFINHWSIVRRVCTQHNTTHRGEYGYSLIEKSINCAIISRSAKNLTETFNRTVSLN